MTEQEANQVATALLDCGDFYVLTPVWEALDKAFPEFAPWEDRTFAQQQEDSRLDSRATPART